MPKGLAHTISCFDIRKPQAIFLSSRTVSKQKISWDLAKTDKNQEEKVTSQPLGPLFMV